mmetsp:Transcript_38186/g.105277  ORF Transcript_38186/g.105277 Transcript_38186/m.105277 type:complete len:299 (-) Transcript_38186:2-898(-)
MLGSEPLPHGEADAATGSADVRRDDGGAAQAWGLVSRRKRPRRHRLRGRTLQRLGRRNFSFVHDLKEHAPAVAEDPWRPILSSHCPKFRFSVQLRLPEAIEVLRNVRAIRLALDVLPVLTVEYFLRPVENLRQCLFVGFDHILQRGVRGHLRVRLLPQAARLLWLQERHDASFSKIKKLCLSPSRGRAAPIAHPRVARRISLPLFESSANLPPQLLDAHNLLHTSSPQDLQRNTDRLQAAEGQAVQLQRQSRTGLLPLTSITSVATSSRGHVVLGHGVRPRRGAAAQPTEPVPRPFGA